MYAPSHLANEFVSSSLERRLEDRIGGGAYREVYREGNLAIKVLKPYVKKDYGLFSINFPAFLYTKIQFGIEDFNKFEYDNYRQMIGLVPLELRDSFAKIIRVEQNQNGSLSINELVTDADGCVSKTLKQYGEVRNSKFWERFNELEQLFLSNNISLFDINSENILVKELENGDTTPVLVDYKRFGTRTYPFQFGLLTESGVRKKIKRRFARIRDSYRPFS